MASIVAKRPVVGVAAGAVFAALGALLISVEGAQQQGIAGILSGLYRVTGYFLLGVACLSMLAGVIGIWGAYRSRRSARGR